MSLPVEVQTRLDQLHATLRRVHGGHHKRGGRPPEAAVFVKDSEGTVRDEKGVTLWTPAKPAGK